MRIINIKIYLIIEEFDRGGGGEIAAEFWPHVRMTVVACLVQFGFGRLGDDYYW